MIDYKAADFWLRLGQVLGYVVLGIYVWLSNRQKATRAEIKAVKDTVQAMKDQQGMNCNLHLARTTTLEVKVDKSPTHADIGAVHDRITGVKGSVDELSGLIQGIGTNVRLLVEYHLKGERP